MTTTEQRIIELAQELSDTKNVITLDSKFKEDLGFDSLSTTELILACEEEFNIEIDIEHEQVARARTLRDLYQGVCELTGLN